MSVCTNLPKRSSFCVCRICFWKASLLSAKLQTSILFRQRVRSPFLFCQCSRRSYSETVYNIPPELFAREMRRVFAICPGIATVFPNLPWCLSPIAAYSNLAVFGGFAVSSVMIGSYKVPSHGVSSFRVLSYRSSSGFFIYPASRLEVPLFQKAKIRFPPKTCAIYQPNRKVYLDTTFCLLYRKVFTYMTFCFRFPEGLFLYDIPFFISEDLFSYDLPIFCIGEFFHIWSSVFYAGKSIPKYDFLFFVRTRSFCNIVLSALMGTQHIHVFPTISKLPVLYRVAFGIFAIYYCL